MLKRYVLAGLMLVFAGSAFAEMVPNRAFIPCVAGAFNCTPGFGQAPLAPVAGGPRPGVAPLPVQPGFPGGPIARPLPVQPGFPGGVAPLPAPGPGFAGGAGVRIGVNVGVHAGPAMPIPPPMMGPCGPRPCAPIAAPCPPVRVRGGCFGCGFRRRGFGCGGGVSVRVNVRVGFGGRRFRC